MHPNERPRLIAVGIRPANQPVPCATTPGQSRTQLLRKRSSELYEWTSEVNSDVVDVLIE